MTIQKSTSLASVVFLVLGGVVTADGPKPATDLCGDPLPKGALARMGTVRWRPEVPICFVRFLLGDKQLLTGSTVGRFQIWNVASGLSVRGFGRTNGTMRPKYATSPYCISLTPDGRILVEASVDGTIRVWDVAAGKVLHKPESIPLGQEFGLLPLIPQSAAQGWALAPDGTRLALKDPNGNLQQIRLTDGKLLHLWNPRVLLKTKGYQLVHFLGPTNYFHFLAFQDQGKVLVSVDTAYTSTHRLASELSGKVAAVVTRWQASTGARLGHYLLPGPYHGPLAFSPDAKLLARTGSDTGEIFLHDARSGKELRRLAPLPKSAVVVCLSFSPNSQQLAALTARQQVYLWNLATGSRTDLLSKQSETLPFLAGVNDQRLAFSSDGKTLAVATHGAAVRLWDVATGKEKQPWEAHARGISALAVTPDGKTLVTGSLDGTLRRWTLATGKSQGVLPLLPNCEQVTVSPDGRQVAFRTLAEWSLTEQAIGLLLTGKLLPERSWRLHLWDTLTGKERWRHGTLSEGALTFSPNGRVLAYRQQEGKYLVQLYETAAGKWLSALVEQVPHRTTSDGNPGKVLLEYPPTLAFMPDSTSVFTSVGTAGVVAGEICEVGIADGRIRRWDMASGKLLFEFDTTPQRGLSDMIASPDGRNLALLSGVSQLSLWEAGSGRQRLWVDSGVREPRFSPDGRLLAAVDWEGGVHVYDTYTAKKLTMFLGHRGVVSGVVFTPDGRRLISSGADGNALVWDLTPLLKQQSSQAELTPPQLEKLWEDLAANDAAVAYQALHILSRSPKSALPWLTKYLHPSPVVTVWQMQRWIQELDHKKFAVRVQAEATLLRLGRTAEPTLQRALAASPSLEMRRRLETLLAQLAKRLPSGQELQPFRALEALERMGTPEARALLRRLTRGALEAPLTWDALEALRRLETAAQ